MQEKAKKRSIRSMLLRSALIPSLVLGVLVLYISISAMINGMTVEIQKSLSVAAHSLYNTYSLIAPGDYQENGGVVTKGERVISGDYQIIDALKESYHMELSLFYGEDRVATTIQDANGQRLINTKIDDQAAYWVLEQEKDYFSKQQMINGTRYFAYYLPIKNSDGSVVGMAFAGQTYAAIQDTFMNIIVKALLAAAVVLIIVISICFVLSKGMVDSLKAVMSYMSQLANGEFDAKIETAVVKREDEIGELGRHSAQVGKELENMIVRDPLTGLYNRRACSNYLMKQMERCRRSKEDIVTVALGDIDFFKKINDKYGHDCGDLVLVTVANIFKEHMKDCGIAARWGGEEFLLIFDRPEDVAREFIDEILDEIRAYDFNYNDQHFNITLSVGVNGSIRGKSYDDIVKIADENLYTAKETGRNKVV